MKNWYSWIFLLGLSVLPTLLECWRSPVVTTKTGRVRGIRKHYKGCWMDVFYGIPYGKPPVGDLRFKRTVPVDKWNGTYSATRKPPACYQVQFAAESLDTESEQSEDCLYLNIWALRDKRRKRAVMIWIYGGSFRQGSGSMSMYDGSEFARKGVILVTFNYRTNIFGYAFTGTKDAPGNAGMYDQVEALKWVRNNICKFGGDPDRITIFGQSAGSISVSAHTLSELSKPLFTRAIMESGSTALLVTLVTPIANKNTTNSIAKAVGCSSFLGTTDIDCMKRKPPRILARYSKSAQFTPQWGDSFLPEDPKVLIQTGRFKNCDRLIGVNKDEGSTFWARKFIRRYGIFGQKERHPKLKKAEARPMMADFLADYAIIPPLSTPIIEYYMDKVRGDNNKEVLRQAYTAAGDAVITCPSVFEAEKVSEKNKVYFYEFTHRPYDTNTAEWTGVTHFAEVPFVFGDPFRCCSKVQYTEQEEALSRRMMNIWTCFAKTGYPGKENWKPYSKEHPVTKILNTREYPKTGYGPHRNNCNVFRTLYGFPL